MTEDEARTALLAALTEVAPEVDPDAIDPGRELLAQVDLDSMDFLSFLDLVAESTGVEVPEADYGRIATLRDAAAYVAAAAG